MLTILATILIGGLLPILLVAAAFVVTSMGNRCASATVVLVALSVAGCEVAPDDVVSIEATGAVEGMAWVDENGTGALDGLDRPVQGVRVELRAPTGPEALYTATTDNNGDFLIPGVVVGDYRVAVDSASVGDTLHVLPVDNPDVTIGADETATVFVGLTYPWATTDSIRVTVPGRRLFVEGRVIAVWNTYGEGMLHIRDRAGGLAAVRVQANSLALGDSARLLGVADRQGGRTVLRDATVVLVSSGIEPPGPVAVSTGMAATADSGRLDAELGRVGSALIQDTLRNTFGERVLRVDDGSGVLDVVLDRDIPFVINLSSGTVIGAPIDATGILTPPVSGTEGVWVLKPRRDSDLTVLIPNGTPTASFTYACTVLDCDFDGTDSSDPDGDALSYAWDFGDGATASGATWSHTYAAAGTYAVTVTVSDGRLTDTDTRDVTVTEGNAAPTASFTFSCEGLDCDFDGTDSSDPDGDDDDDDDDLSYAWDFGDGATASGATTSHTYDDGGTYAVTLTVSDGSLSDTDTRDVTVTAISLTVTGYKVRALQKADLAWSGATSDDVDIFRDGALRITTDNDGAYTDDIDERGGGTYTYQVCEAGTDICSYEEIVTFDWPDSSARPASSVQASAPIPDAGAYQEQAADDPDPADPGGNDVLLRGRDFQVADTHDALLRRKAEPSRKKNEGAERGHHDSNNQHGLHHTLSPLGSSLLELRELSPAPWPRVAPAWRPPLATLPHAMDRPDSNCMITTIKAITSRRCTRPLATNPPKKPRAQRTTRMMAMVKSTFASGSGKCMSEYPLKPS